MTSRRRSALRWAVPALALPLLCLPVAARAQSAASTGSSDEGISVEPMDSGFTVALDNRFSEVDGRFGNFVGGRMGWLTDGTLFVGAGGYWLTDDSWDRQMSYGGLVAEWTLADNDRLRFSVRGLVGGGDARLGVDVSVPARTRLHDFEGGQAFTRRLAANETYFVAEPEVALSVSLSSWLRLGTGVGYRFISGAGSFDNRLRGVSGHVVLQLGP